MISRERMEEATAYVLGALEEEESATFEAALNDSPELQREVAELREVAGLLALAVRPVAPPPELRERIVSDARAVRPIAPRLAEAQRREPSPSALKGLIAPMPDTVWHASKIAGWLVVAASLIGFAVMQNRFRERSVAAHSVAEANAELRAQLAGRDSLLAVMVGPDVETVGLASTGSPSSGRLFWSRRAQQVVLVAFALPKAPSGRTYQLWGSAKGKAPVSLGTFNANPAGEVRITMHVPDGLQIATGSVTEEPERGSSQPTTTPILAGAFAALR
jgi:anti-sigma-K factor RskA